MDSKSLKLIGQRDKVDFICNNHIEYGVQRVRWDTFLSDRYKFICKQCRSEHMSEKHRGENSPTWKGGRTSLRSYLRCLITNWTKTCLAKSNYRCELTGSQGDLEVHHIESFDSILEKALMLCNISPKESVSIKALSKANLEKISSYVVDYHNHNCIGVVLHKDVHKRFHDIYGRGNNDRAQFEEFCKLYPDSLLSLDEFQDQYNDALLNDIKKVGTSKYIGVSSKASGLGDRWVASITKNKEQIHLGTYPTEYRAAKAYNEKAIELFGHFAQLNDLSNDSDKWIYEDSYYRLKDRVKNTSIYTGVNFYKGNWRYEILDGKQKLFRGTANSELEAAYMYNKKKKELLGEDAIINFLTPEEEKSVEDIINKPFEYEFYPIKTSGVSRYTNVSRSGNKWAVRFRLGEDFIVLGNTYLTEKEAAQAYNTYVLQHNLKRKLNKVS